MGCANDDLRLCRISRFDLSTFGTSGKFCRRCDAKMLFECAVNVGNVSREWAPNKRLVHITRLGSIICHPLTIVTFRFSIIVGSTAILFMDALFDDGFVLIWSEKEGNEQELVYLDNLTSRDSAFRALQSERSTSHYKWNKTNFIFSCYTSSAHLLKWLSFSSGYKLLDCFRSPNCMCISQIHFFTRHQNPFTLAPISVNYVHSNWIFTFLQRFNPLRLIRVEQLIRFHSWPGSWKSYTRNTQQPTHILFK